MAPLLAYAIKLALPVLVSEAQRKLAGKANDTETFSVTQPQDIPLEEAAPVAVKAAVIGSLKSKTVWFSLALGILGVVEAHSAVLMQAVGAENIGWILAGIGGISAVLRSITTNSMVDKVE